MSIASESTFETTRASANFCPAADLLPSDRVRFSSPAVNQGNLVDLIGVLEGADADDARYDLRRRLLANFLKPYADDEYEAMQTPRAVLDAARSEVQCDGGLAV